MPFKLKTRTTHEIEIGGHTLPIPFVPAYYAPREPPQVAGMEVFVVSTEREHTRVGYRV